MNSEFKSMLEKDVNNTFFNPDEFTEYHTIDGRKMRVLIDDLELAKRDPSGAKDTDALYKSDILILVPAEEYGARPKVGRLLLLDNKLNYSIEKVVEENGVYLLTLGAYRT
jgi:hypothetical protein